MFKASNINFGNICKIKIPKIIPFCNLKSAKIAKKLEKYFQRQFWKVQHAQNIIKITLNERRDRTHSLGVIISMLCAFRTFQN